ncbi:MAG: hypothetical protein DHS20C17_23340 [Cyclobacteriaceae bacterium]|nr:MAG: hypothetical protein DHS20C17_23340 [Cyclobacteriaceae bacterium]
MLNNRLHLYFPQLIQQLGWILSIFAILSIFQAIPFPNPLVPIPILLLGVVFSFTIQGASLDLEKKMIKQYVGLLGIKIGAWKTLPTLREIVFTSGSYSQQIHSFVSRNDVRSKVYRGFLKGNDGFKMLFTANRDPERVIRDVEKVAGSLNLPAIDYTVKPPNRLK